VWRTTDILPHRRSFLQPLVGVFTFTSDRDARQGAFAVIGCEPVAEASYGLEQARRGWVCLYLHAQPPHVDRHAGL